MKLLIIGAGGFGREVLQWVKDINKVKQTWEIVGFLDDNPNALDGIECDYRVVGSISGWEPREDERFAMAIANPKAKETISKLLKAKGAKFASIIHPKTYISDYTKIGEGLIMYPNSGINPNVTVGDFVTLLSAGIGHDAVVEDYCTISSYCDITGGVHLGKRTFLGSRVTIIPHKKTGTDVYVAAGSVVVTNLKDGARVMGNPATKMDF